MCDWIIIDVIFQKCAILCVHKTFPRPSLPCRPCLYARGSPEDWCLGGRSFQLLYVVVAFVSSDDDDVSCSRICANTTRAHTMPHLWSRSPFLSPPITLLCRGLPLDRPSGDLRHHHCDVQEVRGCVPTFNRITTRMRAYISSYSSHSRTRDLGANIPNAKLEVVQRNRDELKTPCLLQNRSLD